jgi:hypothetical protein
MSEPLYFKQLEIGPMQNYVYLFGDPETRDAAVLTPSTNPLEGGGLEYKPEARHQWTFQP